MANVIPMAGLGSRFDSHGYLLPKPLISVSGQPMIYRVIDSMPESDKWIFILRKEHVVDFQLDKIIKKKIPHAQFVIIDYTTDGQLDTCLLAKEYLLPDEDLFISSCDIGFIYNQEKFDLLKKSFDAIYWTFTQEVRLQENPSAYGWCVVDDSSKIIDISVKKQISSDPFNDHAVVGTFYFKKVDDFMQAATLMKSSDSKVNNEYYVDGIAPYLSKLGKNSTIFDVDLFIGWGTPNELHYYDWLKFCFDFEIDIIDKSLSKEKIYLWNEYFKNIQ